MSGVSRKPGPQPAAAVLALGALDQSREVAAAAVDAGRVGPPGEAVGEAQDRAVELEALARGPRALAHGLECGDLGHPPQDTGPACDHADPWPSLTRSQLLAGAGAVALPAAPARARAARRAGGGDARPGAAPRAAPPTRASRPVFNGRYDGVHPAAVAQPLDARDLAAALQVARARGHRRAHPRGRPQLHRRLDRRRRRDPRPAPPARASSCWPTAACWRAPACARSS